MSTLLPDQQRLLRALRDGSDKGPLRVISLSYAAERADMAGMAVEQVQLLADRLRARGLIILAPTAEGSDTVGALLTLRGVHAIGLN